MLGARNLKQLLWARAPLAMRPAFVSCNVMLTSAQGGVLGACGRDGGR